MGSAGISIVSVGIAPAGSERGRGFVRRRDALYFKRGARADCQRALKSDLINFDSLSPGIVNKVC